jgi:hypothetical protein
VHHGGLLEPPSKVSFRHRSLKLIVRVQDALKQLTRSGAGCVITSARERQAFQT